MRKIPYNLSSWLLDLAGMVVHEDVQFGGCGVSYKEEGALPLAKQSGGGGRNPLPPKTTKLCCFFLGFSALAVLQDCLHHH